jgi:uncharacterized protein (TIGR00290 family)
MQTWVWWSTGKDSAWTLHRLRTGNGADVTGIVTTVTRAFDRVSIHGTRRSILRAQAEALGLPVFEIRLDYPSSNDDYEAAVRPLLATARRRGVGAMAFGDLFLEDVRAYRERLLEGSGIEPQFPLWNTDTTRLAGEMLDAGVEARITCVDTDRLPASFAGRSFDEAFLADLAALPDGIDPCGENGEFHTCVTAGPFFRRRLRVRTGETVIRDGTAFADLRLED